MSLKQQQLLSKSKTDEQLSYTTITTQLQLESSNNKHYSKLNYNKQKDETDMNYEMDLQDPIPPQLKQRGFHYACLSLDRLWATL